MATKEERDDFWQSVAVATLILCGISWFVTFCTVTSDSYNEGILRMYKKLCPIEQLKEEDRGFKPN